MKFTPCFLVAFLFFFSCQKELKIAFEPYEFYTSSCENCPEVTLVMPKGLGKSKISETINSTLEKHVILLLSFDEETEATTINEAIDSFKLGYLNFQKQYNHEATKWEVEINGKVSYEDTHYLTIELSSYIFTGGAHGYSSTQLVNFDKRSSHQISNAELFINVDDFRTFAEKKFREKEKIPQNKSINYSGLMFEDDIFYLPENMGFTQKGLKLLYNPYEVSSFAEGPIEMVLSHNEVKKYLSKTQF